jgi:hypothetical protein
MTGIWSAGSGFLSPIRPEIMPVDCSQEVNTRCSHSVQNSTDGPFWGTGSVHITSIGGVPSIPGMVFAAAMKVAEAI